MAVAPILKKAYWSLAVAGGLYFGFIALLLNGWVQRQALYAHRVNTAWWQNPNQPEQFGFLKNQVRPFNILTTDGETLYGWHVLPLALYARNEAALLEETTGISEKYESTLAFELLTKDPESRLVINFHGNAGTIAQGWRTDTYRAMASGAAGKIHVLTVDYRGFGFSTGSPTESGLITDGLTLVKWAIYTLGIPPERIILLGQSLGTAVATAVAEDLAIVDGTEFKAVILVAAFSDIPTLMLTYTVGGVVPILSPLRPYPILQRFFANRIQETWFTAARLASLIRHCKNQNLYLIHAKNDFDIPWSHSDTLFYAAANATSESGMSVKQMSSVKSHKDLGKSGWINTWTAGQVDGGTKTIRQEIVQHGGHNRITTYAVVSKAVLSGFGI